MTTTRSIYTISNTQELAGEEEWEEYNLGEEKEIGETLNGTYYLHIKGIEDKAGNRKEIEVKELKFDNIAPVILIKQCSTKLMLMLL